MTPIPSEGYFRSGFTQELGNSCRGGVLLSRGGQLQSMPVPFDSTLWLAPEVGRLLLEWGFEEEGRRTTPLEPDKPLILALEASWTRKN